MTEFLPSAAGVLKDLRARYPNTAFLCLGQTIWWDEPMKAVLRRMLDRLDLGGRMVLGVHDTDYFAKARVPAARRTSTTAPSRFELLPHNDGSTRDLWSAAGEISRLFGSETFPTRHDFLRRHVPLARVAELCAPTQDPQELVNEATEAWGWRGLVYTGSRDLIVHTLPLADMGDAVERMLGFGFDGTRESVVDGCCREEARALGERLLHAVTEWREAHPDAHLSSLYQGLYPRLFELLLGAPPTDVDVDCTAHMLRLTPETAGLPRFEFADLFLQPETRSLAARAYNEAVAGSEIYTLDRFGLGAVPFDLVLPKQGRGTLRVTLRAIHVETREPIRIPLRRPVESIQDLAGVLVREFGEHVTLVGKAVALISMLAREFIFVFNEEGSGYVGRTRRMNDALRAAGVPLTMHPILRLRYRTWDALGEAGATLALPEHLAAAFGRGTVPARDFAAGWRQAVDAQCAVLRELSGLARPRDLMAWLAAHDGAADAAWSAHAEAYEQAHRELRAARKRAAALQAEVDALYRRLREVKAEIASTERAKGHHFRAVTAALRSSLASELVGTAWPAHETTARAAFEARIAELLRERRSILERVAALKAERFAIERGAQALDARRRATKIEAEAAFARLRLVRNAILTCTSLPHTDHRPSAWWLPMVDPSGRWFARIAATTELYTEPVVSA